jgi:hypothetical protein
MKRRKSVSDQIEAAYQRGLAENKEQMDKVLVNANRLLAQNAEFIRQINELDIRVLRLIGENENLKGKVGVPVRKRLPDTRRAVTHKFTVGGHEGYMTVGMFDDGDPGELFITMAKEGSTIGGLMDTIGCMTSIALQYGVGISTLSTKFSNQRFEPSGWTLNPEIRSASSIIDYVFRWMQIYFIHDTLPAEPSKEIAVAGAPPSAK